jgi:hypothetical protein
MSTKRVVYLGVIAVALSVSVRAQDAATAKPTAPVDELLRQPVQKRYIYGGAAHDTPPPNWGIVEQSWSRLGATELDPDTSGTTYTSTWIPPAVTGYQRWVTGGFPHLIGYAHVPGGALIGNINTNYCENSTTGPFTQMNVYVCDIEGNCPSSPNVSYDFGTFGTGCFMVTTFGFSPITANNGSNLILVDIAFGHTDGTESIGSVGFGYTLQVSPAPATPTFNDVPTSDPGFQYIEALVASGITAGCGGGNYCPDSFLTRRQMAVFIAKALGLDWPNN